MNSGRGPRNDQSDRPLPRGQELNLNFLNIAFTYCTIQFGAANQFGAAKRLIYSPAGMLVRHTVK